MPVHPPTGRVTKDRSLLAALGGVLDSAGHRWRQRDQDGLAALAADLQHPVAVFPAEIGDVRAAGLEDPQPGQAQQCDQREVVAVGRLRATAGRCRNPIGWGRHENRRTNLYASLTPGDTAALYRYLTGPVAELPGVREIETAPVIRTVKRAGTIVTRPRR